VPSGQAGQRGLLQQSTFVLGIGESSLQRLGKDLPEGLIVGARDGIFRDGFDPPL